MSDIHFTKMHGCANDYIYLDCIRTPVPENISELARKMSRRHFSVGADGIVCICRPDDPANDAKMRMFNADGSEGKMCGNAIRCVGKFLCDRGLVSSRSVRIETLSGTKTLTLLTDGRRCTGAIVMMGRAVIDCPSIPVLYSEPAMISAPLTAGGREYRVTAVSMGNPHAVVFSNESPDTLDLERIGPEFEHHPIFPERVNTEFVRVLDPCTLEMRVWERGSGETYACGTGACAAAAAAVLNGLCRYETPIEVRLVGGTLKITVSRDLGITMEGPACEVYSGVYHTDEDD